jgi:hypothetical protein
MLAGVDADEPDPRFAGSICWICCGCLDVVTEPVAWRPLLTLLSAGVPLLAEDVAYDEVETSSPGATVGAEREPAARRPHPDHLCVGPAFTADDELDLHELLTGDTWFPEFLAVGARALLELGHAENRTDRPRP